MRTDRLRAVAVIVAAATLIMTGCGSDDDGAGSTTTAAGQGVADTTSEPGPAEGDLAGYCDASLAVEAAPDPDIDFETATEEEMAEAFKSYAAEVIGPLVADAVALAPADIAADAESLSAALDQVAETGDPSTFEAPEVDAANDRIHAFELESCGWESVEVSAREYALEGVPGELPAGPVSFELFNTGREVHHLVVLRKNDGVTDSAEELLALPEDEGEELATEVGGVDPVNPGEDGYAVVDLEPGDYVVACFIPVGTTSLDGPPPDGPPHAMEGMYAELTVR